MSRFARDIGGSAWSRAEAMYRGRPFVDAAGVISAIAVLSVRREGPWQRARLPQSAERDGARLPA